MYESLRKTLIHLRDEMKFARGGSEDDNRAHIFLIFCTIGIPTLAGFGLIHAVHGEYLLGSLILLSMTILVISCLYFLLGRARLPLFRFNCFFFSALICYLAAVGGEDGSKLLWMYLFPLTTLFLLGHREGSLWTLLLFLISQLIIWNPLQYSFIFDYSSEFALRFNLSYICLSLSAYFYELYRATNSNLIKEQNDKLNQEIANRKETENMLKQSEQRYRVIFSQAADAIVITSIDGSILEVNNQMHDLLGYSLRDLRGTNIASLIHPADLLETPVQIPALQAGDTILLERRLRTSNGEYKPCEISGTMVGADRLLFLYRDVTQRKAAEVAMTKANEELSRLANVDSLTGIANRRKFEQTMESEWLRSCREYLPLTLILGDIDYFKQYNDCYGHQEGDSCLIQIAQLLSSTLNRPADLVARFGGEEFAIILPNTPLEGGVAIAERMRTSVLTQQIPHSESTCAEYVTMSFGVGVIVAYKGRTIQDLIATADQALYAAKLNGRNRVEYGLIP